MTNEAMYEWTITVRKVDSVTGNARDHCSMTVLAANASGVSAKVQKAFEATYYSTRDSWSHTWTVQGVREVLGTLSPPEQPPPNESGTEH